MSILVCDETKLREPNLLVPGRKPIGPVKFLQSHPAVKHLRHYFLASSGGFQNLAEGRMLSCPMRGGRFSRETGDATQYTYLVNRDSGKFDRDGSTGWDSDTSVIARIRLRDTSTAWRRIFRIDDSDAIYEEGIGISISSTSDLHLHGYANAYGYMITVNLLDGSDFNLDEWVNISFEFDGSGGAYYVYVNGRQVYTGSGGSRVWSDEFDRILLADSSSGNAWDLESFGFFSGRLGHALHQSLGRDPYQLLVPA